MLLVGGIGGCVGKAAREIVFVERRKKSCVVEGGGHGKEVIVSSHITMRQ